MSDPFALPKARFVFNPGVSAVMFLCSEVIGRYTPEKVTAEQQIFTDIAVLDGQGAAYFSSRTNNHCVWITHSKSDGALLVWFDYRLVPDKVVPDPLGCRSLLLLRPAAALDVVENYILNGIIPEEAMPPGHLQSLTG